MVEESKASFLEHARARPDLGRNYGGRLGKSLVYLHPDEQPPVP
jgi:hypothetical protein